VTRVARRTHVIAGLVCLGAFCLISGGCTRSAEAPPAGETTQGAGTTTAGQGVVIEFQSEPDPPASGENSFEVVVTQGGAPVTDATVEAVFSMPAMPSMNMPAMRSTTALTHEGAGRYRGTGQLAMSGTWNVMVTASRGAQEVGRRNLSIVAK
jgi:hypothetical protein